MVDIVAGTGDTASFNIPPKSSHTTLFAILSACIESFDVVTKQYQAIPFNNFALASPSLPDDAFILIDSKQDTVQLDCMTVRNCIVQWSEREETRKAGSITQHLPEPAFNLTSISLPGVMLAFLLLLFGIKSHAWFSRFTHLKKITWIHVERDILMELAELRTGSRPVKSDLIKRCWKKALAEKVLPESFEEIKFEFVNFPEKSPA